MVFYQIFNERYPLFVEIALTLLDKNYVTLPVLSTLPIIPSSFSGHLNPARSGINGYCPVEEADVKLKPKRWHF
jgi:hypothetical protein